MQAGNYILKGQWMGKENRRWLHPKESYTCLQFSYLRLIHKITVSNNKSKELNLGTGRNKTDTRIPTEIRGALKMKAQRVIAVGKPKQQQQQ